MRKYPLLSRETLLQLYFEEKHSLRAIAELTGTDYRLVRDSFKACGLVWRTKSEAGTGRVFSEETRNKISKSRTGWKDTPETVEKKRAASAKSSGPGWNKGLTVETDARMARLRDAATAVMRSPEFRARASERVTRRIQTGTYYARGHHESPKAGRVYYMSGWELRRWQELDADPDVLTYRRDPVAIPYEWMGSTHHYFPDVLITYRDGSQVLEEIKPQKFLTRQHKDLGKLLLKMQAGEQYASGCGWGWRVFGYTERGDSSYIAEYKKGEV